MANPTTKPKPKEKKTPNPPPKPIANEAETRTAIVNWANRQVGLPYIWGGDGPPTSAGFDCSGLCYEAYLHNGITIPRVAAAQQETGTKILEGQLQPADLVFAGTPAFHVGMYIGGSQIVVADHPGVNVRQRAFVASEWTGGYRTHVGGGIVLTSANPLDNVPILGPVLKTYEFLGAIGKLLSPAHIEKVGKLLLAAVIIVVAIVIMNRKKIETVAEDTAKTAVEVAPK